MSEIEKITGSSPEAKSLDIKQKNIKQLKQLFPDVFSENKIDFEALKAVLGEEVDDSEERYNFTWNGKTKARQIAQIPSTGTLRPCKEESVNWDTTENLFIEGDNLEVLKLLQKAYHKKVKMIYIDPPYNTGKEFVYKDNYKNNIKNYLEITEQVNSDGKTLGTNTETSGRYHTDWLNMIYPRLKLARNLLTEDGLIFISIDDNEVENLRKLCSEIYGEDNFLACAIWQKRTSPDARKVVSSGHEYVLAYFKNAEKGKETLNKLPLTDEQKKSYKNQDNDPRGPWASSDFTAQIGHATPQQFYTITAPNGKTHVPPPGTCWKNIESVYKEKLSEGRFWFGKNGDAFPRRKTYLNESEGRTLWTWWSNKEVGHTQEATKELKELMEAPNIFDNPKPTRLIRRILQLASQPDSIVLDFFAGSGSTANSVLKLNREDGGSRKFIAVQIPEPYQKGTDAYKAGYSHISESCKERIKRAGYAILKDNPEYKGDVGYKTLKLDETNIRPWDADFDNLEQVLQQATESIKADRSSEDVLYEIFLKYGYDLTTPVETEVVNGKTVFVVGAGALIVCLDDEITGETVEGIAKLKEELDPETTQVVFKDAGFADSNVKTNAIQILKQAGIDDVKSI